MSDPKAAGAPAPSVQERFAPLNACFGCGPANAKGLRIRSYEEDGELVAEWRAEKHHEAFEGMLSGGITGTLLDCHSNWAATLHLMRANGLSAPPCTVTAEFTVKLLRPIPTTEPLQLAARVVEASGDRAVVEATVTSQGKTRATCRGTFVAVGEGHPAYRRW